MDDGRKIQPPPFEEVLTRQAEKAGALGRPLTEGTRLREVLVREIGGIKFPPVNTDAKPLILEQPDLNKGPN
jgi:hypothetical protein